MWRKKENVQYIEYLVVKWNNVHFIELHLFPFYIKINYNMVDAGQRN